MEWTEEHVRSAVMDLLKTMSQTSLSRVSPLSQPLISYISNGNNKYRLGPEKIQQFSEWYKNFKNRPDFLAPDVDGHVPQDSRLRFHPTQELPLMRNWYKRVPLPTIDQFLFYLNELNRGPVRQERPKVTLNHMRIWWKNERQRLRKIYKDLGHEVPRNHRFHFHEDGIISPEFDRSQRVINADGCKRLVSECETVRKCLGHSIHTHGSTSHHEYSSNRPCLGRDQQRMQSDLLDLSDIRQRYQPNNHKNLQDSHLDNSH